MADDVRIRRARPDDRQRCLELLGLLGGPDGRVVPKAAAAVFEDLTKGARGEVWVAERDGRILGMATQSFNLAMRYGGEYAQLEELIVDPDARGLKLGARLLQAAIESARARGAAEYGLYLLPWTEHNLPFYEKFGLQRVGSELRMRLDAAEAQRK